jgi:hypothetical protein
MVRRRGLADRVTGGIPVELVTFQRDDWYGVSEFDRWQAWDKARTSWAEAHLPGGVEDLPGWHERILSMPDAPMDWSLI